MSASPSESKLSITRFSGKYKKQGPHGGVGLIRPCKKIHTTALTFSSATRNVLQNIFASQRSAIYTAAALRCFFFRFCSAQRCCVLQILAAFVDAICFSPLGKPAVDHKHSSKHCQGFFSRTSRDNTRSTLFTNNFGDLFSIDASRDSTIKGYLVFFMKTNKS